MSDQVTSHTMPRFPTRLASAGRGSQGPSDPVTSRTRLLFPATQLARDVEARSLGTGHTG
jgi:hypothetical protein